MARRMVYHALMEARSEESKQESVMQRRQEQTVLFGSDTGDVSIPLEQHSCQAQIRRQGIPLLILDGDGCDRSHGGEGQTSTRLGAFLEMLNTETDENTDRQEESHDE
mgnify:CR=1 FL=1